MTSEPNANQADAELKQPKKDKETSKNEASENQELNYDKFLRRRKNRPRNLAILGIVAIIALIVGIVIYLATRKTDPILGSESFFLAENDTEGAKYALFDKDGNRLTEFDFDDYSNFTDGYALVRSGNSYGVINSRGKFTIDFDEYSRISTSGGLYLVSMNGSRNLVLGNGKKIGEYTSNAEFRSGDTTPFAVIVDKVDGHGKVDIYTAKGDLMQSAETEDVPNVSSTEGGRYSLISSSDRLMIIDSLNIETVYNEEEKTIYSIAGESEKDGTLILGKGLSSAGIAVFKKGKITNYESKCDSVRLGGDNRNPVCVKDYREFYIDEEGEVSDWALDEYVVYDKNHYGHFNKDKLTFSIYSDGEKIKTVKSTYKPSVYGDKYYVFSQSAGNSTLYSLDAEVYQRVEGESGYITELDGGEFVLCGSDGGCVAKLENGREISGTGFIKNVGENYFTIDNAGNAVVLNKTGVTVKNLGPDATDVSYDENLKLYIVSREDQTEIYGNDWSQQNTTNGEIEFSSKYYAIVNEQTVSYYNRNGKQIHQYQR